MPAPPDMNPHYKTILELVQQGFTLTQSIQASGVSRSHFLSTATLQQRQTLLRAELGCFADQPRMDMDLGEVIPDLWNDGLARCPFSA